MAIIHHALSLLGKSKICKTPGERREIERFRYQVYVSELRKPIPWADHAARCLVDPIDHTALHFYRRDFFGQVAAYVRVHMLGPDRDSDLQALEAVIANCGLKSIVSEAIAWSYMSRLMVARDWRGAGVVPKLLTDVYHYGRRTFDARLLFCHCSPRLVRLYERIGLHRLGSSFEDPHVGTQVAMVLLLDDLAHFRHINSFLYIAARKYSPDDALLRRLKRLLQVASVDAPSAASRHTSESAMTTTAQ